MATDLCGASTGKINYLSNQEAYYITPEIRLQSIVYVDDIAGGGSKKVIEGIGKNLEIMEEEKGFTFGIDKTNYMIMKTGREKDMDVTMKIKRGEIQKVEEYKYVGIILHEDATIERHLQVMLEKGIGMIKEVANIGSERNVGILSSKVQIYLYQKTVIQSILYNLEGITYWRIEDRKKLEYIQGKLLKNVI